MPMKPTHALQEQVHWRVIALHHVGIDVEGLLQHLRPDDDKTSWPIDPRPGGPSSDNSSRP